MLTLPIRDTEAIAEASFGCWINALWGFVAVYNEKLEFTEHKEAFFILLRRLLEEERVVLFPPIALRVGVEKKTPCRTVGEFQNVWAIPYHQMMDYMRIHWPQEVSDANDSVLNDYWYGDYCPRIGWIDEGTGEIVAS